MPEIRTLGDLVNNGWVKIFTGPFGSALHKHDYTENGVTVVPAEAIVGGALDKSRFNFIGSSKSEDLDRYRLEVNDVVFARRGAQACGLSALVKEEDRAQIAGTGLIYLRVLNEQAVDPYFLFLSVSDGKSVGWLKAHAVGATMPNLNGDVLKSLPITLPSMEQQRRVSNQHRPLASKLRLNFEINQTLEQMTQAIFKSWFVDFEPVKAKIAAKQRWLAMQPGNEPTSPVCYAAELMPEPPQHDLETTMTLAAMEAISGKCEAQLTDLQAEQPERYAALRATAELFPSAMQDSELGEIPERWEVGSLSDIIEFNPRRSLKKGAVAPYLDMKNVPTVGHVAEDVILREMKSSAKYVNGDTLLARITPCLENGKTAFVDFLEESQVGWGSTEYIVMRPTKGYPVSLGYFIARDNAFRDQAIQSMTGTSGRQRASAKALADSPWLIYPKSLVERFDAIAGAYLRVAKNNGDEAKSLEQLRDTLLPKLLSGELSVSDAESQPTQADSASSAACKAL